MQQRRQARVQFIFFWYNMLAQIAGHSSIPRIREHRLFSTEGRDYIRRLLDPTLINQVHNCRKIYRMSQSVFREFCHLLRREQVITDSANVSIEEKFTMFVLIVGQDQRYGVTRERFGQSAWTISTYFNEMLNAILRLKSLLIGKTPSSTPSAILEKDYLYPYFKVKLQ
jgi:hypothetical protein